jgi:N utilization substance protein A
LEELELSTRVQTLLDEAGYETVGDLMVQMEMDADAIADLEGVGPKSMEEIESTLSEVAFEGERVAEVEEAIGEVQAEVIPEPVAVEIEEAEEAAPAAEVLAEEMPAEKTEAAEVAEAAEVETLEEGEEEEKPSLDALFDIKPEDFENLIPEDEFEDEEESDKKKEKKKKKKKYVQVEYDPEKDAVIVKRQHKRGGDDWEEDWNL